jgi:rSAM/selenodomain-associated transferase 1
MLYDDTVILLFAKAPIAGSVNTRLIPDVGVQVATRLQVELIHQRLSILTHADLCSVELYCAPVMQHACFLQCEQQYSITLKQQVGKDLGQRMLNAAGAALKNYKYCMIIGTDAPALNSERIKQSIEELKAGMSVVFVPAEDGGYVLVGLQQAYDFLFKDISWGSAEVMQQSCDILLSNDIAFTELHSCWDIDRIEDYQRYLSFRESESKAK